MNRNGGTGTISFDGSAQSSGEIYFNVINTADVQSKGLMTIHLTVRDAEGRIVGTRPWIPGDGAGTGTGGAGAGAAVGAGDANGSGSAGDVPPHVHSYEWKTTKEPTADADGEEIYVCGCGDVKYRQGLSAMGAFDRESADKVLKAGYGAIVNIETSHWNSLGRTMKEAMIKRSDVSVKFSFLSEGHKGTRLNLTIPAGYDINSLYDENGYCGLCHAGTILGYDQ